MTTFTSQPDETSGVDSYIRADNPTANYGTADVIPVGRYNETAQVDRALLKFDLSSILPAAQINSATLTLTMGYQYSASEVNVYRLKRAWVESEATWNIYSTGHNWGTAGATGADDYDSTSIGSGTPSAATTGTSVDISLTASKIKEMIDGTFTNNGFLIKSGEGDYTVNGFASSAYATASYRPKLVIQYQLGGQLIVWSSE